LPDSLEKQTFSQRPGDGEEGERSKALLTSSQQSRTYGRDTEKEPTTNLFVGNFPFEYREEDLRDLFRAHGELKSVTVGMDRQTGRPKGHGFVEFNELDDAIAAFKALQGADVGGRTLRLDYDQGLARKAVTPRDRPRDDGARYGRLLGYLLRLLIGACEGTTLIVAPLTAASVAETDLLAETTEEMKGVIHHNLLLARTAVGVPILLQDAEAR
jgi:hypothetical protein